MIRPVLALSALIAAVSLSPSNAAAQQEQGVCQTEMVGCSAGPQNCATLEFEITVGAGTVHVTKYCYQPV